MIVQALLIYHYARVCLKAWQFYMEESDTQNMYLAPKLSVLKTHVNEEIPENWQTKLHSCNLECNLESKYFCRRIKKRGREREKNKAKLLYKSFEIF